MSTPIIYTNNAATTLAANLAIGATTVQVAAGQGALFPLPTGGAYFTVTLVDALTGLRNEICYCTARSGDFLTVTRAQEGTANQAWLSGDAISNLVTAGGLAALASSAYPNNPEYLKTISDILNSQEVSLFRFCDNDQINDILASTVSLDISGPLQSAVEACLMPQRAASLIIPGRCWINASVNINRPVDNSYSDFIIKGQGAGAGFFTTGNVTIFDSTIAITTAPVSERVVFEDMQFETSSVFNASYLLSKKFLRMKTFNCTFNLINYMNASDVYTQEHDFLLCNILNNPGIFLNAYGSYDTTFLQCKFRNGNTIMSSVDPSRGTAGLKIGYCGIQSMGSSILLLTGCAGFSFAHNHCESNATNAINTFSGGITNLDVSFSDNYIYNPAGEFIYHGPTIHASSTNNECAPNALHSNAAQVTNLVSNNDNASIIADVQMIRVAAGLLTNQPIRMCDSLGANQAGVLYMGSGVPGGAAGNNGDFFMRTDTPGVANQRLYNKQAGTWTGIL